MSISRCAGMIVLSLVGIAGCGSDSDSGDSPVAKCERLQTSICTRIADCAVAAGTITQSQRNAQYNECISGIAPSLTCGKAKAVSASFDECLSTVNGASCEVVNASVDQDTLPEACIGAVLE